METTNFFSEESIVDSAFFQDVQSDFTMQNLTVPEPDDEDENEDEEESDNDSSNGSDNDNPPLDKDVVHSPVTPQTGGKPKQ